MWKLTSCNATTASSRELCPAKVLLTLAIVTVLMDWRLPCQSGGPGQEAPNDAADDAVDEESNHADGGHADDHIIGAQDRARIVDEEAEARARAHQLGRNQCHPSHAQ